jgi:hypothetical protein
MIPSALALLPFLAAGATGHSEHGSSARLRAVNVLEADWQRRDVKNLIEMERGAPSHEPDACSPGGGLARVFADARLVYRLLRGTGLGGGPHLVLHFEAGGTCDQPSWIPTSSWRPLDPLFRAGR